MSNKRCLKERTIGFSFFLYDAARRHMKNGRNPSRLVLIGSVSACGVSSDCGRSPGMPHEYHAGARSDGVFFKSSLSF